MVLALAVVAGAVGRTLLGGPDDHLRLAGSGPPGVREGDGVVPRATGDPDGDSLHVDEGWVADVTDATGVPQPAVRAYAAAAVRAAYALPGCRIGWPTLAGIGWVESQHGTLDGRVITHDATSDRGILGPALDGTGAYAAVPATKASRRMHGDPRWDHAVGPMQFLPSTWRRWAADGDRDGRRDANDLDDAAWSAARFLCADDRDLATGSGWDAALLSYNDSRAYVEDVRLMATRYTHRSD